MNKLLRNVFFARETKCIEMISAISFMLFTLLFVLSSISIFDGLIQPMVGDTMFYVSAFMIVSLTQFAAVAISHEALRSLRCVTNYISGVFWVWIGISSIYSSSTITIGDIACFVIGIGVFYAFIIHILILRHAYFIGKTRL